MIRKYKMGNSLVKDIMRNYIIMEFSRLFKPTDKSLDLFSLPADNFYFEDKIKSVYPEIRITTVERDKKVYKKGIKKAKQLKINHNLGTDYEVLRKLQKQYNILWLDYCAMLTSNILSHLVPIAQGNYSKLNKDGEALVCVTLMKGRESILKELSKLFNIKKSDVRQCLGEILNEYASWNNYSIETIKVIEYKDSTISTHSVNMLLYIFKIKNKKKSHNKTKIQLIKY